ncbi:MAG TPA: S8 family serine peptidase [Ignavibacteria bacterium]|nr:S8 family serine peptidase [Ignavibacteria bacterium]HRJ05842.1 S8 family serine peptidase [Ignavibacteria bacterium]
MKRIFLAVLILASFITFPAHKFVQVETSDKSRFADDHIIVKLKKSTNIIAASFVAAANYESTLHEVFNAHNIKIKKTKTLFPRNLKRNAELYNKYEFDTYYVVYFEDKTNIPELCNKVTSENKIDFAEPDFIGEAAGKMGTGSAPNDALFSRQWGLHNDGSVKTTPGKKGKAGADMNVLKAWEVATGSSEIIVAILDSGTKIDHPDISSRIWVNKGEVKNGRDDDGNGFVDDINGYNFSYDNANVRDDGGHGTNIAGTVGATTNNSLGYAGIDQNCRLMICKNLDDENLGEYSWWSASLYYAANNGARVINMSEGGYDYSKTLENAINFANDAGALIVASMMNKNNGDTYYPASFKNVLAVGATDTDDSRCREFTWGGGSNWGKHIAVVAPGNRVYGLDYKDNSNYDVYWSGTSQSTAYVSGVASILLGQDPSRTNKDLREIITQTAIDQVGDPREDRSGWDQYYGFGRVDLFEAVNYGNFSSGKRETKKKEEIYNEREYEKEQIYDESNGNSTRAKANDGNNRKNRDEERNDKRGKKPKADDR